MQWDRRKLWEEVSPQLNPKNPPDVIFAAASLLGDYHIQDAVRDIARFIALENNRYLDRVDGLPLWSRYPIVDVLIKMGQPAVSPMLDNLATSDDEKVHSLSAFVIRDVYYDLDVDKLVIQKAILQQADAAKKQRLQAALKYFGDVPIPLEEPGQPAK